MMQITNTAIEIIDGNLNTSSNILHKLLNASSQPKCVCDLVYEWDELRTLQCLIDEIQCRLMSDLSDI